MYSFHQYGNRISTDRSSNDQELKNLVKIVKTGDNDN